MICLPPAEDVLRAPAACQVRAESAGPQARRSSRQTPGSCRAGPPTRRPARPPRAWPGTCRRAAPARRPGEGATAPLAPRCWLMSAAGCTGVVAGPRCSGCCASPGLQETVPTWQPVQARPRGSAWSQPQQAGQHSPPAPVDDSLSAQRSRAAHAWAVQPAAPAEQHAAGAPSAEAQPQQQRGLSVRVCNDTVCSRQVGSPCTCCCLSWRECACAHAALGIRIAADQDSCIRTSVPRPAYLVRQAGPVRLTHQRVCAGG